jgi:uncharacterized protein YuzE
VTVSEPALPSFPITYDQNADALYFRLTDAKVADTRCVGERMRVNVDVDASGEPVGVEILDPLSFTKETGGTLPAW